MNTASLGSGGSAEPNGYPLLDGDLRLVKVFAECTYHVETGDFKEELDVRPAGGEGKLATYVP